MQSDKGPQRSYNVNVDLWCCASDQFRHPMRRCCSPQHINHLHLLSCLSWTLSTMQAKQSANRWEKYRWFSRGSCFQHLILGIWGFGDHFIIFIPPRSLKSDRCADFRSDPFGNILMVTISKNFQCLLFEYLYFMKKNIVKSENPL